MGDFINCLRQNVPEVNIERTFKINFFLICLLLSYFIYLLAQISHYGKFTASHKIISIFLMTDESNQVKISTKFKWNKDYFLKILWSQGRACEDYKSITIKIHFFISNLHFFILYIFINLKIKYLRFKKVHIIM